MAGPRQTDATPKAAGNSPFAAAGDSDAQPASSSADDALERLKPPVRDGVAHAVMLGAGENYFGAYGIFLRASNLEIGLLAALPPFLGALFQFFGVRLMERHGIRRPLMVFGAIVQAFTLVPIALLGFWPDRFGYPGVVLIVLVVAYWAASGLVSPIWSSVIGDLVPMEIRGRYFGARNKLIGLATMIALIGAGLVLEIAVDDFYAVRGFCAIFLIAAGARLVSAYWLRRYEDPPYVTRPDAFFTFRDFVRRSPKSNFARFVFFQASMNCAVFVSAPYFTVYMLRDLQLSYMQFTILTISMLASQLLSMTRWGDFADRFGNKKILSICSIGIISTPILWLITPAFWMLVVAQVWAGFFWAGYNLSTANFMFDTVSPPKRGRCAAYQSFVNAAFVLVGVLIGAVFTLPGIVEYLQRWSPTWLVPGSEIPFIIVLSLVLRVAVFLFWIPRFREVREVEPIGHRELIFRIAHVRPSAGATYGILFGASGGTSPGGTSPGGTSPGGTSPGGKGQNGDRSDGSPADFEGHD